MALLCRRGECVCVWAGGRAGRRLWGVERGERDGVGRMESVTERGHEGSACLCGWLASQQRKGNHRRKGRIFLLAALLHTNTRKKQKQTTPRHPTTMAPALPQYLWLVITVRYGALHRCGAVAGARVPTAAGGRKRRPPQIDASEQPTHSRLLSPPIKNKTGLPGLHRLWLWHG